MPKKAKTRKTYKKSYSKKSYRKKTPPYAEANFNQQAQWKAYRELQAQADLAWKKFRTDVKKNAQPEILARDQSHLFLILGECNYMAKECWRMSNKRGKIS